MRSPVSRRYAEALLESAVEGKAPLDGVRQSLMELCRTIDEVPELRDALMNPSFTPKAREAVLDVVLERIGGHDVLRRFLHLLLRTGRIPELADISLVFARLTDARAGRVHAEVHTPVPLDEMTHDALKRALEKQTGKSVELAVMVDPDLIGGMRAQVGSEVFDGSLRAHLERLKSEILNRA